MHSSLDSFGWTFMLVSCVGVTLLTFWCFSRVLTQADE